MIAAAAACHVTHVRADFDGDRRRDVAVLSARPHTCREDALYPRGAFTLVIRLASGEIVRRRFGGHGWDDADPWACANGCELLGARDLDGDGRAELAMTIHHAAAGFDFRFFQLRGRALRRVDRVFYDGGSVTSGGSVACRRFAVVQIEWGALPTGTSVDETWLRFAHGRFYRVRRRSYRLAANHYPLAESCFR